MSVDVSKKPDIVTTIEPYVQLKKIGNRYQTLCPFHGERYASFIVDPIRQRYHCFGCGADGDSIQFVMDYCKVSFKEALDLLNIKPSKKTYYKTLLAKRKQELTQQFRQWCADYYDDICSLYRTLQKAKEKAQTIEQVEALAEFYHQEPLWLHHIEILQGNDDREKLNLYREVAYGQ